MLQIAVHAVEGAYKVLVVSLEVVGHMVLRIAVDKREPGRLNLCTATEPAANMAIRTPVNDRDGLALSGKGSDCTVPD